MVWLWVLRTVSLIGSCSCQQYLRADVCVCMPVYFAFHFAYPPSTILKKVLWQKAILKRKLKKEHTSDISGHSLKLTKDSQPDSQWCLGNWPFLFWSHHLNAERSLWQALFSKKKSDGGMCAFLSVMHSLFSDVVLCIYNLKICEDHSAQMKWPPWHTHMLR